VYESSKANLAKKFFSIAAACPTNKMVNFSLLLLSLPVRTQTLNLKVQINQ
jgi:hypothetical protein